MFMLMYYAVIILFKREVPFPLNANNFIIWFIYYYLGTVLGNSQLVVKKIKNFKILLMLSLILQIIEGVFWYKLGYYGMAKTQLKLTAMISNIFILTLAFYWLSNNKEIEEKWYENTLIKIGDMSFGIYLSHILILEILDKFIFLWKDLFFPLNTIIVLLINYKYIIIGRKILGKKNRLLGLS